MGTPRESQTHRQLQSWAEVSSLPHSVPDAESQGLLTCCMWWGVDPTLLHSVEGGRTQTFIFFEFMEETPSQLFTWLMWEGTGVRLRKEYAVYAQVTWKRAPTKCQGGWKKRGPPEKG